MKQTEVFASNENTLRKCKISGHIHYRTKLKLKKTPCELPFYFLAGLSVRCFFDTIVMRFFLTLVVVALITSVTES